MQSNREEAIEKIKSIFQPAENIEHFPIPTICKFIFEQWFSNFNERENDDDLDFSLDPDKTAEKLGVSTSNLWGYFTQISPFSKSDHLKSIMKKEAKKTIFNHEGDISNNILAILLNKATDLLTKLMDQYNINIDQLKKFLTDNESISIHQLKEFLMKYGDIGSNLFNVIVIHLAVYNFTAEWNKISKKMINDNCENTKNNNNLAGIDLNTLSFAKFHNKIHNLTATELNSVMFEDLGTRSAVKAYLQQFTYENGDHEERCLSISVLLEIKENEARILLGNDYNEPLNNKIAKKLYEKYCENLVLSIDISNSQVNQQNIPGTNVAETNIPNRSLNLMNNIGAIKPPQQFYYDYPYYQVSVPYQSNINFPIQQTPLAQALPPQQSVYSEHQGHCRQGSYPQNLTLNQNAQPYAATRVSRDPYYELEKILLPNASDAGDDIEQIKQYASDAGDDREQINKLAEEIKQFVEKINTNRNDLNSSTQNASSSSVAMEGIDFEDTHSSALQGLMLLGGKPEELSGNGKEHPEETSEEDSLRNHLRRNAK